jgi:hypothetical protein
MKKLIIILLLTTIYQCNDKSKKYKYEVYQNGTKIDEICTKKVRNWDDSTLYYKNTGILCHEQTQ